MPNKMLIDATHPEETRVVVVRGNRVEEFDFETAQRKQLRGNIYLAKVTRVEPSLQAAFVEYGGNRHGFLAFSEIHPDYYQIPVADRQALIEAEEQAHREAEEESENRSHGRRRSRHRNSRRRSHGERVRSDIVEGLDAGADPVAQLVEDQALPEHADGTAHEGENLLHADAGHHGEHEGHDHHDHDHHDHEHDDHDHDDHHHANDDVPPHDHDHDDHGHDEHDHHDHDHADETPAPVAAIGAEPAVAAETVAEPQEAAASEAHAEALAEAVTSVAEPADAVYAGESAEAPHQDAEARADEDDEDDEDGEDAEEEHVESVGGDDVMEEVPERTFRPRRQYKIQEVIKRRQVMLVQVVKEERGNKGAALTTYLSLAGRYAVLMPNTARGGGISRKITSAQDRSRLKEVVQDLDVPEGMGIILRTAGAARTKPEIKRDFEYLIRMWETVRDLTLKSQAPTLVYEEGSLIKRSLRDLYNKEIDEISVAGESGYREARDFMKMLMPANVSAVKQYRDGQPLFSRMGVESQLDAMFSPTVQLRSGGYIVINQTEALVSIDVNSGRSTREHHIEDTALKTNLEAAEEVARQLRLRDLAGLIVIDFIDMDEKRNNRAVERKLSDCLRQDRARIQVGRISHFGLLEMSRQRIRASVLESSTDPCPHCGGTGHVRSVSSVALQLLRGLEEILMKGATHNLVVRTRTDVALYVLNHKRGHLRDLENGFKVSLSVIADPSVSGPQAYLIDRGEQVHTLEAAKALLAAQAAASPPPLAEEAYDDEEFDPELESEVETEETEGLTEEQAAGDAAPEQDGQRGRKRRRRRRGRGGQRDGEAREDGAPASPEGAVAAASEGEEDTEAEQDGEEGEEQAARGEQQGADARRRRRGRRGGRRRRGGGEEGLAGSIGDELGANPPSEATDAVADFDSSGSETAPSIAQSEHIAPVEMSQPEPHMSAPVEAPVQPAPSAAAVEEEPAADDKAARRRSTVREKVSFLSSSPSEPATPVAAAPEPVAPPAPEPAPEAARETPAAPRRAGWWSRRFGGGE